jgi:hypothetical protein
MKPDQYPTRKEEIEKGEIGTAESRPNNTGSEKRESFHESEYKKYKKLLEETLEEFDLKTLNEAENYIDEAISSSLDDRKKREEKGERADGVDGTYRDSSLEDYQNISEAIKTIKALKGRSVRGLDIEETLDCQARNRVLSLNELTDEKFTSVLSRFKGKSFSKGILGNENFHDVGELVHQLRQAVINLGESKYSKLIEKQFEERDEEKIIEIRKRVSKINVS